VDISGKTVGFAGRTVSNKEPKYLNTSETPVFHKSQFLFCLDKAKTFIKKDGVIFVEGQMDAITAHQFGFHNIIASGGTSLTPGQLKMVARYTKDLVLCFDSDTAGSSAIKRGIELAEKEGFNIKVILIPSPYKDIDEMLHSDLNLAKDVINNPIPIYDFYLAAALKKNDKSTAIGKKKIMEELSEEFSGATSTVIMDHYIKKISEELDLAQEIVKNAFEKKILPETREIEQNIQTPAIAGVLSKKSPQEYMIALLLKAPLDTAQTFLYKLGQKDFVDSQIQDIFTELKDYLLGRKQKFKIEYFEGRLDEDRRKLVEDLYLWDLGDITEEDRKYNQELDATFDRIKKESAKKDLKELTEQIKQAELEKDSKLIKELTEKVKAVSARLA
jgi:DNA primase